MENLDIVAAIGFLLWSVNIVLPFILGITTGLVYFWSRGKVNLGLASRYQAFKWREDKKDWTESDPLLLAWEVHYIRRLGWIHGNIDYNQSRINRCHHSRNPFSTTLPSTIYHRLDKRFENES